MSNWENFEIECTKYLNDSFGTYAKFIHQGGSDSTVPDIYVETPSTTFYIEAKHSPAQCGQFVLTSDISTNTFQYSPKNINKLNIYAQKIIEHMNNSFDEFCNAGTVGKDIIMDDGTEIFSNWIIDIYQEKGVRFFITNNQTILPIHRFKEYFDVTAKYRIKRSGSSSVGKNYIPEVVDYISTHDYPIQNILTDNNKLFIDSWETLHQHKFIFKEYEYMFSKRNDIYEIRKLSNTYHANVIFSIKLKSKKQGLSPDEFISALK